MSRERCTRLLIAGLCFVLVWTLAALLTGHGLPGFNYFYNSYSLQAQAWLQGRLDLEDGGLYEWLELAQLDGKYYVSFPPFPSLVLLPLVLLFGAVTPDGFVALAAALLSLWHAMALAEDCLPRRREAGLWVLYLLLGNGYLYLCLNGWVWFLAQNLCFCLSLAALHHARRGRGGWALSCWAAAVGCRPMAVIYGPMLLWILWRQLEEREPGCPPLRRVRSHLRWVVGPVLLAAFYMTLNVLRFGNPLEFGHSYLPEFQTYGSQFSLRYLPDNLLAYLAPPMVGENGALRLQSADGGAAWLVNPIFWTALAAWIVSLRRPGDGALRVLLPVLTLAYLTVILCHRTLGAWQFGNRYLVDLMPWVWYGILCWQPAEDDRFTRWNLPLMLLGTVIQFLGTVAVYNGWY